MISPAGDLSPPLSPYCALVGSGQTAHAKSLSLFLPSTQFFTSIVPAFQSVLLENRLGTGTYCSTCRAQRRSRCSSMGSTAEAPGPQALAQPADRLARQPLGGPADRWGPGNLPPAHQKEPGLGAGASQIKSLFCTALRYGIEAVGRAGRPHRDPLTTGAVLEGTAGRALHSAARLGSTLREIRCSTSWRDTTQ